MHISPNNKNNYSSSSKSSVSVRTSNARCAGDSVNELVFARRSGIGLGGVIFAGSVSCARSGRGRERALSSSSLAVPGRGGWLCSALPHVSMKTPANVARHPYRNVTIWCNDALRKSWYSTAEPTMAEMLKNTNCAGITTLESNFINARFRYFIWPTPVPTRTYRMTVSFRKQKAL